MINRGEDFKEIAKVKKRIHSGDIKLSAIPESNGESMYEIEFSNKESMVVSLNLISQNLMSRIEEINFVTMILDQIVGI